MTDSSIFDHPEKAEKAAAQFKALLNPNRMEILKSLQKHGQLSVYELCETGGMEQSYLSHQLAILREGGLVKVEKQGRKRLYCIDTPVWEQMNDYLRQL
jgi:ArsR family transcriptional regulator, zinc-responsive transcriptional repressor